MNLAKGKIVFTWNILFLNKGTNREKMVNRILGGVLDEKQFIQTEKELERN